MRRILALVTTLLLPAGCASWTVESQRGTNVSLDHYRSFAWADPSGSATLDPYLAQRVRDQVAHDLARRGIHPAAPNEQPDFLVDTQMSEGAFYQTIVPPLSGYAPGASGGTYVAPLPAMTYQYNEAHLTLDFIDARSGRIFWHGFAAYGLDRPAEAAPQKAAQAARKMLRKYPAPAELASAARPSG